MVDIREGGRNPDLHIRKLPRRRNIAQCNQIINEQIARSLGLVDPTVTPAGIFHPKIDQRSLRLEMPFDPHLEEITQVGIFPSIDALRRRSPNTAYAVQGTIEIGARRVTLSTPTPVGVEPAVIELTNLSPQRAQDLGLDHKTGAGLVVVDEGSYRQRRYGGRIADEVFLWRLNQ